MNTLVVYDSQFGNTKLIAQAIGEALETSGAVHVMHIADVTPQRLENLDAIIVGSPTQRFRPTLPITTFLKSLPTGSLEGVRAAAFDTRLTLEEIESHGVLAFFVRLFGYAAKPIGRMLSRKGGKLILPPEGFYVEGMQGPLVDGEFERVLRLGKIILDIFRTELHTTNRTT
jgi:menaquinone-dependent protoporphyrinogen IX oxidase